MNKLIQRMTIIYGVPDHTDHAGFYAELAKVMKGYCEEELDKAADIVIRSHKGRSWPSVSEMLTACAEAREFYRGRDVSSEPERYPEWSKAARAYAYANLKSSTGRRAAKEGWILGLERFLREKRRHPNEREIADLKETARGFDHAYARVASGEVIALAGTLKALGDSMLERRNRYADIAQGDE